ncbi:DUF484 family protein [Halotalea alkalilenta]|uniref:DUF484 family protein n=1 Tax=Halotalea alkalilenta TaxID=376489 RepID=UPI000487B702|nr:DUF484 family protein [Halotalea alkalilenta]
MNAREMSDTLDPQRVAEWLETHPEFFVGRDALLERLKVPHPDAGRGAVSLLERQTLVMRRRLEQVERRLQGLIDTARDTEIQYRQLRALVLALLESEGDDAVLHALADQLGDQFEIPAMAVWRPMPEAGELTPPQHGLDSATAAMLEALLDSRHCRCVALDAEQWRRLLPTHPLGVASQGSGAVTRLSIGHHSGYLLLATPSRERFNPTLDTLFVDYLGEVVGRLLQQSRR